MKESIITNHMLILIRRNKLRYLEAARHSGISNSPVSQARHSDATLQITAGVGGIVRFQDPSIWTASKRAC